MRHFINLVESASETIAPPPVVYHGSNTPAIKDFEYREGSRFVLFHEIKVKANGFYFALTPEDATEYGRYVSQYHIKCHNPLIYDGLELYRDIKRRADLHYILSPLFTPVENEPDVLIFDGLLHTTEITREQLADPRAEWVAGFVRHDSYGRNNGLEWEVLDNPSVVSRMRERGYDSTTVFEPDHKGVRHSWFVLNPQQIEYLGPYDPEANYDDDDWS